MVIETERTLRCQPADLTAEVLTRFLDGLDPGQKIRVRTSYPDRPGELGEVTLSARLKSGERS